MVKPSQLLSYGVAILSVALALVLTLLLQPLLSPAVLPLFFLAVTFSASFGGRGPGFTATILSVLATRYFLLPPLYSFFPVPSAAILTLIVFSLVTLLVSFLEIDLRMMNRRSHRHFLALKQTEAALQESYARFQAAAEGSFDAIYILRSVRDKTGAIVDFEFVDLNQRGANLISLNKKDVIGQKLCELLPVNRTQGFFEKYRRVVETGIPLEEEFSRPATSTVAAEWLHHQVVPLVDGIAITTRDITERKRAEEALQASEALYRSLAEGMPQLVWMQNAEGQIDYANQQWQKSLGTTLEEVEHKGWAHLVHPDDLAQLKFKELTSVETGDAREAEFRYRMADGSYHWFLGRCVPVKDPQGQVIRWVGTSTDIHDLKRYEQQLAQHRQQFRTLAENSPDIISRMDRQMRHVYVNSAIARATGISPDVFIGKTHDDLNIPAHLRRDWQARLRQVFATGQPCSYEFAFPAPDGIRHYLARLVPEFGPNGVVETILGITSDITEFKRVEQSLRESEWRFRRVMESNMIGMGFWSLDGTISDANDALLNLLGYTREEFLAQKPRWNDLTPPEYHHLEEQALEQIQQSGVCTPFEKEYLRQDGSRVPILCGGASFRNSAEGGVFFVLDLSDRKQVEKERDRLFQLERAARAEAESASRVKDEFLMVLSHELRTPLNPILGWARLLQTRQFEPGMVNHALSTIERNARQQVQVVDDLLDVSRILQGKLTLNCALVNLLEVIEGAIASVRLSAQAKSITIETHLDATVRPVLGNAARLQQVVWNLLSNAIKFTPPQGRVEVRLEAASPVYARIQVIDTGKGIASSFIPYVFDYFRQADSTITRSAGGLGLGLAIARHLVELHGGTIEAASEGESKGSIFTVQLPVQLDEVDIRPTASEGTEANALLQSKQILVVGAEDDTQELIAVILRQAGAAVVTVGSTATMLEQLARSQPNLIISSPDVLRENNYELTQRLRLWFQEFGEEIPLVVLVSAPEEIPPQEMFLAGIQRVLPITLEPDVLVEAIAQLSNS
ncbi:MULTISPECIES: PAS domain S-box protein [unclassified Leptolyngbya]|uniref:PAS domain S-box protein n=1 Tax=unclassified Leptolyngbya TaxID=2650499 RepID=UPI001681E4F5|nr:MULTISPECIES: PAS domain S-box protein [unclassified Leptolyngbya]MBD1909730.1 PAS domain S-box protein [Leptolyngbya sp. FACHB-8]MBD2155995.1 PAS domain S-box protein [Leptolyngbya sp. FACHB-16]